MIEKKKKRGRPRTRPIKYTEEERRLLAYPPTKETWMCPNRYGEENTLCDVPNGKNHDRCWVCGFLKPENPEFAWTRYEKICAKVEIDPELRKPVDIDTLKIKGGEEVRLFGRLKKQKTVIFDEPIQIPDPVVQATTELVATSLDSVDTEPVAVKKAPAKKAATKPTKPATTKAPKAKTATVKTAEEKSAAKKAEAIKKEAVKKTPAKVTRKKS